MADTPVAAAVNAVKESQTPSGETPTTPAVPQNEPSQDIWAKKERALQKQRHELSQQRKAWEAEQAQIKQKYESEYIPKSKLSEDPLSTLLESGLTMEKLTELVLTGHNSQDPTVRALRSEIKAIKDQQLDAQRKQEEQVKQQYDQAVNQIKNEVKSLVDSNPSYETIKQTGMQDAVLELITQTFESEGYLMDVEEAAKQVEDHLVDEAVKMASLNKVQTRLKPQPTPEEAAPEQNSQAGIKTLTNKMTQTPTKKLTEKERRERAIAAFYANKGQ